MQLSRFLVLTGHLNDYPLSDLVGILRHQRKTGRLLIEYPNGPASFFFNDGELVDAQLDNLSGLQAICVAIAQPPSSFNFNPVIRPTRRSIENSLQKVVSELLGCWGENELDVETIAPVGRLPEPPLLSPAPLAEVLQMDSVRTSSFLALPPGPTDRLSRPTLAMAAAGLLLLGLSTVIAVTGAFGKKDLSTTAVSAAPQARNDAAVPQPNEGQSNTLVKTELLTTRPRRANARGKDSALSLEHSTRAETRDPSINKKEMESSEENVQPSSPGKPYTKVHEEQNNERSADGHSVKVVLKIEGGRVAQASIANHRSGMEAYEALALRIARQRRYQSKGATQETVTIKVSRPK